MYSNLECENNLQLTLYIALGDKTCMTYINHFLCLTSFSINLRVKTEQKKKVKTKIGCDIFDYSVFQLNITRQSL